MYLVEWSGWHRSINSWETADAFVCNTFLLTAYQNANFSETRVVRIIMSRINDNGQTEYLVDNGLVGTTPILHGKPADVFEDNIPLLTAFQSQHGASSSNNDHMMCAHRPGQRRG